VITRLPWCVVAYCSGNKGQDTPAGCYKCDLMSDKTMETCPCCFDVEPVVTAGYSRLNYGKYTEEYYIRLWNPEVSDTLYTSHGLPVQLSAAAKDTIKARYDGSPLRIIIAEEIACKPQVCCQPCECIVSCGCCGGGNCCGQCNRPVHIQFVPIGDIWIGNKDMPAKCPGPRTGCFVDCLTGGCTICLNNCEMATTPCCCIEGRTIAISPNDVVNYGVEYMAKLVVWDEIDKRSTNPTGTMMNQLKQATAKKAQSSVPWEALDMHRT